MKLSTIVNACYLVHALASTAVVSAQLRSNANGENGKKSSLMITAAFQGFDETDTAGSNLMAHEKTLAESCLVQTFNIVHSKLNGGHNSPFWQMTDVSIVSEMHVAIDDKETGASTDNTYNSLFSKFMTNYATDSAGEDLGQSGCNRYCPGDEYSLSDFYETSMSFRGEATQHGRAESNIGVAGCPMCFSEVENSDVVTMSAAELNLLASHRFWEEHFCDCLVDLGFRGTAAADKCIIVVEELSSIGAGVE